MPPNMGAQTTILANPTLCKSKLSDFGFTPIDDDVWNRNGQVHGMSFKYRVRFDVRKTITKYEQTWQTMASMADNVKRFVSKKDTKTPVWHGDVVILLIGRRDLYCSMVNEVLDLKVWRYIWR